ncbi:hypothetical protein NQ176_g524 [Zarea fungicola]|uniref:Uncharacterized protein n=1 Tax=Zarea fungicola TaxID=93591 RepID=A0ACC1NX18_9HYPO|nr:hypothetical protein NQ176_g524 [Lecanicillium fungicola]
MRLERCILCLAIAVVGASITEKLTPDAVEADINSDQDYGNRAFGTPGYNASVQFILERAVGRFGKQMDTTVQTFTHPYSDIQHFALIGPDSKEVVAIPFQYSDPTPPAGLTGELIEPPAGKDACFDEKWSIIDAAGKVVLVDPRACSYMIQLALARAHGAVAAVVYYFEPGGRMPPEVSLTAENIGKLLPAGLTTLDVGTAWKARRAAGETLHATLIVQSSIEERESWNIIVETKEGDPNNVVMLGAHLDSVRVGSGINDDGSGSAGLLELMGSFQRFHGFQNKVRFAWWGAEEAGLVGSKYYTSHLTDAAADKIRFYFNYDMIASPNATYAVFANDDTDMIGAQVLLDYFKSKGLDTFISEFGKGGSDWQPFIDLGIPASGTHAGSSINRDPCYHRACDTLDNINMTAITHHTKAAGRVAAQFALSLQGIPSRQKKPQAGLTTDTASLTRALEI